MCFLACVILRFTSGVTPADCVEVQHGSRNFSIHILTDLFASIGGGLGQIRLKPMTVRAAHSKHGAVNHSATPTRLIYQLLFYFLVAALKRILGQSGNDKKAVFVKRLSKY